MAATRTNSGNLPQPTVIRPAGGWIRLELRELLEYVDLILILTWRNIKIRYKQTLVGASWAVIQPVLTMLVFTLVFGKMAQMPSEDVPYPIFAYSALVPWTFFVHALTKTAGCLVNSETLLTKVYFPRLCLPIAAVLAAFVDFLIPLVLLIVMMLFYGVAPTVSMLALPLFVVLVILTALGIGLWLAAINVQYRDVGNALPFLTQLWLFLTPIAYPSSMIPDAWQTIYALNPMVGVIEGFRWTLLGATRAPGPLLAVSCFTALVILVGGVYFFRHKEDIFADVV